MVLRPILIVVAGLLALGAPAGAAAPVERIVLDAPDAGHGRVELFLSAPPACRRSCAGVLLVHGHQWPDRLGGRTFWDIAPAQRARGLASAFDRLLASGFVAAAVSQPGYGGSDGPSDFSGPHTQEAVRRGLALLRGRPEVDPARVALYGFSRGAAAAAMVATADRHLRALVLVGGIYDLAAAYPTGLAGLDENIEREAGTSAAAFAARSALREAPAIRAATLVLHGRSDRTSPAGQAEALADAMRRAGNPAVLRLIDSEHVIPFPLLWGEVVPFLRSALD